MTVVATATLRQPVGETGLESGTIDLGGMAVRAHLMPAGADGTSAFREAFGDGMCPVAHYMVITRGALHIRYTDDGSEELASAGDIAYLRPGHTVWTDEETELVEISASDGNDFLQERLRATGRRR